jgi:6-phosphofructokinase 2
MPPPITTVTVNPSLDVTAHAERVDADRKIRCNSTRRDPGGGGINVARAVHLLGGTSRAVWTRGGLFGAGIATLLDEAGIEHRPVPIDGETRLSYAVIEDATTRHFRFSGPGPILGAAELDAVVDASGETDPGLLVVSGGLPPGAPDGFYARLVVAAAGTGARVILDTHGTALHEALRTGDVFLAKPNYRELFEAAGREPEENETEAAEPDLKGMAREIIDGTGTVAVLISLGAGGALLVTADDALRITAPTVPIRSRIGAGDSMVGGVALRLAAGDDLADAARYGVAAGTAAVMTPGTELCRRDDVERLYDDM